MSAPVCYRGIAMKKTRKQIPEALWLLLAGALLLRLLLALVVQGYPYDMSCFVAWSDKLAAAGPAGFYSEGYFADYPPGYLYVLWLVGALRRALHLGFEDKGTYLLLALVPALCDCACAALVWRTGTRSGTGRRATMLLTAFTAFDPLLLFDTGAWKQIDGAFSLPLILCFLLLEGRRWLPAALCYGIALAIKPQALIAGPVLAVCFAVPLFTGKNKSAALGRCLAGAAVALCPVLAAALPFLGLSGLRTGLWEKYFGTSSSYPYATVNAFNWGAALGGNWQPLESAFLGPVTWQMLGLLGLAVVTVLLLVLACRSLRSGTFSPLLLAGFYLLGVFTFAHCMHERYLIPGVLLVLLAAVRFNDVRLFGAGFGLSLTGFVNLAAAYAAAGSEDEWMMSATARETVAIVGFAETVCFLLLAFAVWDICAHGSTSPLPARPQPDAAPGASQPRWTARELAGLLGLTVLTAAVSFWYLGDTAAPQNPVNANGTSASFTVEVQGQPAEVWVYPGISTYGNGRLLITTAEQNGTITDVKTVVDMELSYANPFTWSRQPLTGGQSYTVTVTDGMVMELSFRDAAGAPLTVTGGGALCDEPDLVPGAISQLNSFYFDEIYHARTGYEQLHRMQVYETTHPPLGKDLIMAGIALFGMTGFGWRFSGTLFGVLLVPLAWCFARRLTRRPWLGALTGALLALDLMRFAQSRIATIDIYGTFFILLGAYFMLWYCQSVLEKGVYGALLPMALGGVAFGLGCAAKWTGIYAGAGLAVLYLGVLYARWQQKPQDFWREFRMAAYGGVVFYVLLPLCIYIASYLPYWWRDPSFSLSDWWNCQLYMFNYHAGLESTHPFESRWYTWLLGLRPVWYYYNGSLPAGTKSSIAGLAGPVIWLAGLAALLWLLWRQVSGRGSRQGAGVLILYAAQLLPWMLVTRCTFLYHYFPSSMFCLAAIVLVLSRMRDQRRAKRIGAVLCAAALVVFVWFYPAVSGLPVPTWWAYSTKVLPSFGFY